MTGELWVTVVALVVVALIGVVMGRRLVRFTLEIFGLKVGAEGDRSRGGVEVVRSRAGRHIIADNHGDGGVRINGSTAVGDIRVSAAGSSAVGDIPESADVAGRAESTVEQPRSIERGD